TGWKVVSGQPSFSRDDHDGGSKTILGRTGFWTGEDVVRICLDQPACARFLVRKVYREFVSEAEAPEALLAPLADEFRRGGYDVSALLRTVLRSRWFFSPAAYRKRGKSPTEYVIAVARALRPEMIARGGWLEPLEAMGQELLAPPNVKGWEGGRSWLSAATVLARQQFARAVADGVVNRPAAPFVGFAVAVDPLEMLRKANITRPDETVTLFADRLVGGDLLPDTRGRLTAYLADGSQHNHAREQRTRDVLHALLNSAEYQLA